jgi:ketosteroid isomerase-like protein
VSADWVETVRRAFALAQARDLDALLEVHHPRVEIVGTYEFTPVNTYYGHDGVRRWLADIDAGFDDFGWELEDIREVDDGVLVSGTVAARAKDGEVRTATRAWVFRFEDDRIRSVRTYRNLERAMDALQPRPHS